MPDSSGNVELSRWFRNDQPFWLPPGSIRASLVLIILLSLTVIYIVHKWAPPELVALAIFVTKDYFVARREEFNITSGGGKAIT